LAQPFVHLGANRPIMKRDFSSEIRQAKEDLRRTLRALLREMTPADRATASLEMCRIAAQLPAFIEARCVALFAPLPSEPDIHPLIEEAWAQGKRVVLPRMIQDDSHPRLEWRAVVQWGEVIEPGPFGLREPDPSLCSLVEAQEVNCVFVPGLAFDDQGFRLGRGGGFYDYFLGHAPTDLPRFGLMFRCQRVAAVPREPHDQALPVVITEDGLTSFGRL